MNQKLVARAISRCLCVGGLLCSAAIASADTLITFQVDMTPEVGSSFIPGTDTVSVHGSYNSWGSAPGFLLTNNPAAANSNIYSGTLDDTGEANGKVTVFKYVIDNATYENPASGNPRAAVLPTDSGASLILPLVSFDDAGLTAEGQVTFQVDMSQQENIGTFNPGAGDYVEVHGSFNGWGGGIPLTQETGDTNIWSLTVPVDASTNAQEEFKFVTQPGTGWESLSSTSTNVDPNTGNRFFNNFTQTLPVVFFDEVPYSTITVTNNVTFEIDMSIQETLGGFNPATNMVEVHGDFDGWGSGITLTNDPNSSNTNLYSTVIQYVGSPGETKDYKYVIQPGTVWENITANGGNRIFNLPHTNGNFVIGPDYFSLEGPSSLFDVVTVTNETVTFTVNMTNAVGTDGTVFNPGSDTVWLNGIDNGIDNNYWSWSGLGGPPQYQMTQIGSSELYTVTVPVNRLQNIDLVYKYGIDGQDNEAGFADNHMRYIRSQPHYTMPVDIFGSQGATTSTEPSFGDLTITTTAGGISLSWLGRQHVHLQATSSLNTPSWTPLPATDGTNLMVAPGGMATTNYSTTGSAMFYELAYP